MRPRTAAISLVHRHFSTSLIALALLAATSTPATASDATLRVAVNGWSKRIAVDARAVTRDAKLPGPLSVDATRFRRDALRAHAAVAARKPGSAQGRRARRFALAAFADFAQAGTDWAASARARLGHDHTGALAAAQAGTRAANTGNLLLVAAGKLLRR